MYVGLSVGFEYSVVESEFRLFLKTNVSKNSMLSFECFNRTLSCCLSY